ncbi:MAG: CPBP family intramembrane metalloprotease [Chloroflexi bacterium]|nr:MAG: CPBP family intramembrane metalloprotease [Chloroflexota bacterium]
MLTSQTSITARHPIDLSNRNSKEEIQRRAASGNITWTGPLVMVTARSIFAVLAQALVAFIFWRLQSPDPLRASTAWWPVTGTLIDIGCLALLFFYTRREGIRLIDLVSINRSKLGKHILIGVGGLVVLFPLVMFGGSFLAGLLVFGTIQPALPPELMTKVLPLWAVLYSRIIWWPIWSVIEEMTYDGYTLPRLQVLTGGRTWLAILLVGFGWALQHAFLPFMPDLRVFMFLFIQMLPLVIVIQLIYLRFRSLVPTIIMHWGMDLISTILMISVA